MLTGRYAYRILELIQEAEHSIKVLAYVVNFNMYKRSDKASLIFYALSEFRKRKGRVEMIMDYPRAHKPNYNCNKFSARRLKERGIETRFLHKGTSQHAKLFLFDESIAVFGSHNLTRGSVISSYDISIIIDTEGPVQYIVNLFSDIWADSIEA